MTKSEPILSGTDRLRFAPAERSGAAEFPPHLFESEDSSESERPPSAAPSREARIFLPPIQLGKHLAWLYYSITVVR